MNAGTLLLCLLAFCVIEDTSDREAPECARPIPPGVIWDVQYLPASQVDKLCKQRVPENARGFLTSYRACTYPRFTSKPGLRNVSKVSDYCIAEFVTLIGEEYRDAKHGGMPLLEWERRHVNCRWGDPREITNMCKKI